MLHFEFLFSNLHSTYLSLSLSLSEPYELLQKTNKKRRNLLTESTRDDDHYKNIFMYGVEGGNIRPELDTNQSYSGSNYNSDNLLANSFSQTDDNSMVAYLFYTYFFTYIIIC